MILMSDLSPQAEDLDDHLDFDQIKEDASSSEADDVNYDIKQLISGPSPCDNCKHIKICKDNNYACDDFSYFVDKGEIRHLHRKPLRRFYIKVFCSENGDELSQEHIREIKYLNTIRGMTHNMIADRFYIIPLKVRQIVEDKYQSEK